MFRDLITTADTHFFGPVSRFRHRGNRMDQILKEVQTTSPRLVVCAGDIFDKNIPSEAIPGAVKKLVKMGNMTIWIDGNHEERHLDKQAMLHQHLRENNVKILDENNPMEVLDLGEGRRIGIIGVPGTIPHDMYKQTPKGPARTQMIQEYTREHYVEPVRKSIEKAKEEGFPVYVFIHVPITGESYGRRHKQKPAPEMTEELMKVLDPSIVIAVIHGHLHEVPFGKVKMVATEAGLLVVNAAYDMLGKLLKLPLISSFGEIAKARQQIEDEIFQN